MRGWCAVARPCHPPPCSWVPSRAVRHARLPPRPAGYQELRTGTEIAYHRARELLPALERAQRQLSAAQAPANAAASRLTACNREVERLQAQAAELGAAVDARLARALGSLPAATHALALQHAACLLEGLRAELGPACVRWAVLPAQRLPHDASLPVGAQLLAQSACLELAGGERRAVTALVLSGELLLPPSDADWDVRLHWAAAGWQPPPEGWCTHPPRSQPAPGSNAWETPLLRHHPVLQGGEVCALASLHSCLVQVPLAGPHPGLQFVLRRGHDWVKAEHAHDFWVDLVPAATRLEARGAGDAASGAGGVDAAALLATDGLGEWDWAEGMVQRPGAGGESDGTVDTRWAPGAEPPAAEPPLPAWVLGCKVWAGAGPRDPGPEAPGAARRRADQLLGLARALDPGLARDCVALCDLRAREERAEEALRAAAAENEAQQRTLTAVGDETLALDQEVARAMAAARKGVASLRGRLTEVTQRDLEGLAGHVAVGAGAGADGPWRGLPLLRAVIPVPAAGPSHVPVSAPGRPAYVRQVSAPLAGLDAAVLAQVYADESEMVVGIAVAEAFPDGALGPGLVVHWGLVSHQHGTWQPAPHGCSCDAPARGLDRGACTDVPLAQFNLYAEDGSPVFVDPVLNAAVIRLPRAGLHGMAGLEFLLRSEDGRWMPVLAPHGGGRSNCFIPLHC
uniref:Uncharacterized protein n=1 Tax=Auxenochlorella protothecoides TaxID=3075 RepID=A0A1D2AEK5_AUXPR